MSAFYIWNPYILSDNPKTVEFVLMNGDVDGIANDKEFVQHLFKDMGIEANVESWSIEPYRSNYYSDYLDEDDWRDIWQAIWKVRVVATEKINSLPVHRMPSIATNATGHNWLDSLDDDTTSSCLVIADFKSESDLEKAQAAITNSRSLKRMQNKYAVGTPIFHRLEDMEKYKQLQIDLGKFNRKFFANGADYAERVIRLCKKSQGTTNYQERRGQ